MDYLDEVSALAGVYAFFYYFVLTICALYVLQRFGVTAFNSLVVLIFWSGLVSYIAKVTPLSYELYRVIVVLLSLYLFLPKVFSNRLKYDSLINISFFLFSFSFFISNIYDLDSIISVLSQYGFKYGLPFLLYHGLKDIVYNPKKANYLAELFIAIILFQVGFSILKVTLFGFIEAIVGSLSSKGAGAAVVLPILAFWLYWLMNRGKLSGRRLILSISFLFIAIASIKRAPVFIFPIILLMMGAFIGKKPSASKWLGYLLLLLILTFVGIKTNPTLNPEHSMWGSVDAAFVGDYILRYSFGSSDISQIGENSSNRGGSLLLFFEPEKMGFQSTFEYIFGKGIVSMSTKSHGINLFNYGIEHEGLYSEAVKILYSLGYIGLIFYLSFAISLIRIIDFKKFRYLVLGVFFWEFFLYSGVLLNINAMAFLLVFIALYSNIIFYSSSIRLIRK